MSLTCPTCQRPVPGMNEPTDVGCVVSCTCGKAFVKLDAAPIAKGSWKLIGAKTGRAFWLTVVVQHSGPSHHLTVVHRPAQSADPEVP